MRSPDLSGAPPSVPGVDQGTLIDVQPESAEPHPRRTTSKGIAAGDIVLVDKKGRARIMDFGITKMEGSRRLTFGGFQPVQRRLVAVEILGADGGFERRCRFVLDVVSQPADFGTPLVLTDDVANAVHQRLAEVRLQGALMTGFEGLEPAHRGNDRVLHEVRGIAHAAGLRRKTAVRPTFQRRYTPLQQPVQARQLLRPPRERRHVGGQLRRYLGRRAADRRRGPVGGGRIAGASGGAWIAACR